MSARRLLGIVEDMLRADKGDVAVDGLLADPSVRTVAQARRERSLAILRGVAVDA